MAFRTYQPPVSQHGLRSENALAPLGAHAAAKDHSGRKTFFVAATSAATALALSFGLFTAFQGGTATEAIATENNQVAYAQLDGDGNQTVVITPSDTITLAEVVAQKCLPSVVSVDAYVSESSYYDQYYQYYGYPYGSDASSSDPDELIAFSLGSGVVLTSDGYIITNNHVVSGGEAFTVTIEGTEYDAEFIGSDPSSDVAVLKAIGAKDLTPMEIGDSDDLSIGEWVMTIGSPFGWEQSVASGIVSATSRSQVMEDTDYYGNSTGERTLYVNLIQTDAAINPGNSGGALVDAEGKLIGINTLITSYSGGYSGVGFAIPVNYAYNLAQQIIEGKTPTHAQLGVTLSTVTSSIAQRYGLNAKEGAYVAGVMAGSGAEAAGLQEGDIIVAFEGAEVTSATDLTLDVRSKAPGDQVAVTIVRGTETLDLTVTLGNDEASQAQQAAEQEQQSREQEQRNQNPNSNDYGYGWGFNGGNGDGSGNGDGYGYGYGDDLLDELLRDLFDYYGDNFGYGYGDGYGDNGGNDYGYGWGYNGGGRR